jgi:tripartite-type tricarboxylate transporter receptor subunit TctC
MRFLIIFLATIGIMMQTSFAGFPDKTIRLIVPWKAGGGTDTIARGFVGAFADEAGVDVVISNVVGGAGSKGVIQVQQSKNDGYTLLLNGTDTIIGLNTFKKMPFTADSFDYVGGMYTTPTYVLANKKRGYTSLSDAIEKSKKRPGELIAGVAAKYNAHDVMAHAINGYAGAKFRIVAFGGGANLKKAILANEIDICIIHAPVALAAVKEGILDVIGTGGSLQNITYGPAKNMKTLNDLNIPAEIGVTRGLYAPKGTPKAVMEKLSQIMEKAAKSEKFNKFGNNFGFSPVWLTGKEFRALHDDGMGQYADIKAKFMSK